MSHQNFFPKLLSGIAAIVVALPLFWMLGGVRWLDTRVFPPRRPREMPGSSIWIEAPALPISWHHGWWFGCDLSPSGLTDFCRLVGPDGKEVYSGEYLPCSDKSPIPASIMALVPPPPSIEMWIADKRAGNLAPVGALKNGDLLLPVDILDRCDKFKQSGQ